MDLSSAKEVDELLFEISKAFEDVVRDDNAGGLAEDSSCKKHGIGKVLKVKAKVQDEVEGLNEHIGEDNHVKVVNNIANIGGAQRRLKDLSKEEHESKMRATQEKLRQSYQRTLPKRHAIVLDRKDLPDLKKRSMAPTQTSSVAKRKLQNGSQPIVGIGGNLIDMKQSSSSIGYVGEV